MASERLFFPLLKRGGAYPVKGDGTNYVYGHYREYIAKDCIERCVYCDCHQSEVGGPEMMQLDHFRPESLPEFEHLCNDPLNLHYSCGRCNLLKSNHWPCAAVGKCYSGTAGFVDPFADDRTLFFDIKDDGVIEGRQPPAKYLIDLLQLGREHLRKLREKRILVFLFKEHISQKIADCFAEEESKGKLDPEKVRAIFAAYDQVIAKLKCY